MSDLNLGAAMKQWARAAWSRFAGLGCIGWIAAAVYGGALALIAAWALLSWGDSYATKPFDEVAYLVCLVFAVGCAAKAAGRHGVAGGLAG